VAGRAGKGILVSRRARGEHRASPRTAGRASAERSTSSSSFSPTSASRVCRTRESPRSSLRSPSARPKIADYPFTTLTPNLGVARLDDRELVVADIPGLIEGASRGLGLGEEFLRHVERTRLLVHVVDASRPDPLQDIATIDTELESYGHGLEERPRLVALNKLDLPEAREAAPRIARALAERGVSSVAISAAAREGTGDLLRQIFDRCPPREAALAAAPRERRIAFAGGGRDWKVKREGEAFRIEGDRVVRLASGLDWESPDAAAYFQRQLIRTGIERELRVLGAKEGDTVRIGSLEMEWSERAGDE